MYGNGERCDELNEGHEHVRHVVLAHVLREKRPVGEQPVSCNIMEGNN